MTPRKMKKKLKSIRWDLLEDDPSMVDYRKGGEYSALRWLKAYSEKRASAEPLELVASTVRAIRTRNTIKEAKDDSLYIETLLRYA